MLSLEGLKLKDVEAGFMSRTQKFALFHSENRSVKALHRMTLKCGEM